ncbi:ACP S-malonyltransferase [Streptomyces sp. NPDC092952]|uniref:ACP S-malonyltransferase n=1 Tax=Streptomyces sp. NPDC092952 TaxID=3366018 RepID=UPI0038191C16
MPFAVLFPGQGAQSRGMGGDLFDRYPGLTEFACDLLGYDLVALCRDDPDNVLSRTEYTQPALFVVNSLHFFERVRREERRADCYLGHSLGEYNALLAAGAFDFETGLRMVKKRGELMAAAPYGGMTAVLDLPVEKLLEVFRQDGVEAVDLAGLNTDTQTVVAGPAEALHTAHAALARRGVRFVPLRVGGPFHSRYMDPARIEFEKYLKAFAFGELHTPVIANATGLPYRESEIVRTLCDQLVQPVRWSDSVRFLLDGGSPLECEEICGRSLLKMVGQISDARDRETDPTAGRGERGIR